MFDPLGWTRWPLSSGPHPPALSLIPQPQLRTVMMSSTPPPDKLLSLLAGTGGGGKCRYCLSPAMLAGAWNLVLGYFFLLFDGGDVHSSVFLYYYLLRALRRTLQTENWIFLFSLQIITHGTFWSYSLCYYTFRSLTGFSLRLSRRRRLHACTVQGEAESIVLIQECMIHAAAETHKNKQTAHKIDHNTELDGAASDVTAGAREWYFFLSDLLWTVPSIQMFPHGLGAVSFLHDKCPGFWKTIKFVWLDAPYTAEWTGVNLWPLPLTPSKCVTGREDGERTGH